MSDVYRHNRVPHIPSVASRRGPSVREIRDRIAERMPLEPGFGGTCYGRTRSIGDDKLVVFHPSGRKFAILVAEIEG